MKKTTSRWLRRRQQCSAFGAREFADKIGYAKWKAEAQAAALIARRVVRRG